MSIPTPTPQPDPRLTELGLATFELPWDAIDAPDPVAAITEARESLGDTFSIVSGGTTYVFVFGMIALRNFYDLPEKVASKGLADYRMLLRKLPPTLFEGRPTFAHDLFGASDVTSYLPNVDHAINAAVHELIQATPGSGSEGHLNAFDFARRLGHRIGVTSWFGRDAPLDELIGLLDVLDGAEVFVHPSRMVAHQSGAEVVAMAATIRIVENLLATPDREPSFLDTVATRWDDAAPDQQAQGIAYDLVLLHIATMTNLFAAIGWALTLAAQYPNAIDDADHLTFEAIRLGQRSLISREVLRPTVFDAGHIQVSLEPGMVLATMAPVTNRDIAQGNEFVPSRWADRGLHSAVDVTTFGHGSHRCPAQRFSMQAITRTVNAMTKNFELTTAPDPIVPLSRQVGGMARPQNPIQITYRKR